MTTIKLKKWLTVLFLFIAIGTASSQEHKPTTSVSKHAIETSPLMPLFNIWGMQYQYQFSPNNHLTLGLAYQNIKYKEGRSHSPTIIIGYRRYFWKGLHLEYQLWPAYNFYYENNERKYYSGFELWNEFRVGYTINFRLGNIPLSLSPQVIGGFGLYPGNKPESFFEQVKKEPLFIYPIIFVGYNF